MHRLSLFIAICIATASLASAADEKPSKATPAKQKQAATKEKAAGKEKADPVAQFTAKFGEWKALLAKMAELREQYQTDVSADKPKLEAQFQETLQKAQALGPQLTVAA